MGKRKKEPLKRPSRIDEVTKGVTEEMKEYDIPETAKNIGKESFQKIREGFSRHFVIGISARGVSDIRYVLYHDTIVSIPEEVKDKIYGDIRYTIQAAPRIELLEEDFIDIVSLLAASGFSKLNLAANGESITVIDGEEISRIIKKSKEEGKEAGDNKQAIIEYITRFRKANDIEKTVSDLSKESKQIEKPKPKKEKPAEAASNPPEMPKKFSYEEAEENIRNSIGYRKLKAACEKDSIELDDFNAIRDCIKQAGKFLRYANLRKQKGKDSDTERAAGVLEYSCLLKKIWERNEDFKKQILDKIREEDYNMSLEFDPNYLVKLMEEVNERDYKKSSPEERKPEQVSRPKTVSDKKKEKPFNGLGTGLTQLVSEDITYETARERILNSEEYLTLKAACENPFESGSEFNLVSSFLEDRLRHIMQYVQKRGEGWVDRDMLRVARNSENARVISELVKKYPEFEHKARSVAQKIDPEGAEKYSSAKIAEDLALFNKRDYGIG